MLKVNRNKGFHLEFKNGLTISVQFGSGNYCANRTNGLNIDETKQSITECINAEIAIWDKDNTWFTFSGNQVKGWIEADEVGIWIDKVRRAKNIKSIKRISAKNI